MEWSPESVSIPDLGVQREVVQQAVTYCEARPHLDLFYIADPPFGLSVQDIEAFKTGAASSDGTVPEGSALHSSYGALYYPWITFLNPSSNMNVPIPPSGAMAGTYAATDTAIGPWQVAAGITYGVLNIATGDQTTILELAATIGDLTGREVEKEFLPPRAGDVRHSWADVGEAQRVIGFEPRVSLRDGLQRAVDWFLEREPVA